MRNAWLFAMVFLFSAVAIMGEPSIEATIDAVDEALQFGMLLFPVGPKAAAGLSMIARFIKLATGGESMEEETLRQITALSGKMDQLSYAIRDNNANLRKLIVEHEFTYNIIIHVETMEHLMRDVLKYRSTESIKSFQNFCNKNDPHHLVINILRRLNHDVTNPLIFAMEADKLRSKATFDTWRKTINNLLGTLQCAHTFAQGLNYDLVSEAMEEAIDQVKDRLDTFIAEYKPNYWPHVVEQIMRETADRYHGWNYGVIADKVKDALEAIYTTDEFYVIVYNQCAGYGRHAFIGNHVAQFRRGGCNMVVARSTSVHYRSDDEKNRMSHEVMKWAKPEHIVVRGDDGMKASRDHIYKAVPNAGFVGLIGVEQNIHIKWTGGNHLEPGRWTMCPRYEEYQGGVWSSGAYMQVTKSRLTSDVMLIVGFH